MPFTSVEQTHTVRKAFAERNALFEAFFAAHSQELAEVSSAMSARFLEGGRLVAFGKGAYVTDAQHVSVEFVHPVIVGKRALPALDISASFRPWLEASLQPQDMVMGFTGPDGDAEVDAALRDAGRRGAMVIALPRGVTRSTFVHQELLEVLYHTLWETVHVFFEHRELKHDVGDASFLYPFLGQEKQETGEIVRQVAESMRQKVAEDARLRTQVAEEQSQQILDAATAMGRRLRRAGKLILFGNGGSATDANDFAIDCFDPPEAYASIPAISLSSEPANITALANDIGVEVIFLRQLIAHGRPGDIAVGISTSGGSKNVIAALEEARKREMLTVALLGYDGGEIVRRRLTDHALVVRSEYIPRIQEVQASTYHVMRDLLEVTVHGD